MYIYYFLNSPAKSDNIRIRLKISSRTIIKYIDSNEWAHRVNSIRERESTLIISSLTNAAF